MKVALFIPCYVDQLYPKVAMATLELLEKYGVDVDYPEAQTCCGQPMANTGCADDAKPVAEKFVNVFKDYDYIVCPSGSCTSMVKNHYKGLVDGTQANKVRGSIFELCEFLTDILKVNITDVHFPHKVGLHNSCHGLRELRLAKSSECNIADFSKVKSLLNMVQGLELAELDLEDECCGFGGTFAVAEEALSCKMGKDRITDHRQAGAEYITGFDMSCLMHLEGLLKRKNDKIKVIHIAQILLGKEDLY